MKGGGPKAIREKRHKTPKTRGDGTALIRTDEKKGHAAGKKKKRKSKYLHPQKKGKDIPKELVVNKWKNFYLFSNAKWRPHRGKEVEYCGTEK